jgi:hypothetical protein
MEEQMGNASLQQNGVTSLSSDDLMAINGGAVIWEAIFVAVAAAILHTFDYDAFRAGYNEGYAQ